MKQPGVLIEHGGHTYLCVEGGYNAATRSVTLLAQPGDEHFPQEQGSAPIRWRDQGDWFPIARLEDDELVMQNHRHGESADYAGEVLGHYLSQSVEEPEVAWALASARGFSGTLEDVLPQGLAVAVYDDVEAASSAAEGDRLVPIQRLAPFLTQLAREGYAGAMWNGEQPLFFCIDEGGDLQFLRIGRGRGETLEMEVLDPRAGWEPYDGAEEIAFLDNSDACDARLAQVLDGEPLLGWPQDGRLWVLGPRPGEPGLLTVDEDKLSYALLFTDEQAAKAWLADIEEPWVCWSVDDLAALLTAPSLEGRAGLLNPGAHRARRGVFWRDGEGTVLDSFSGFWVLADGRFSPLAR